jgi:hypothetical protein
MYNLPNPERPEFKVGEYNCATFPEVLNVSIPADTGKLKLYLRDMIEKGAVEWKPSSVNR